MNKSFLSKQDQCDLVFSNVSLSDNEISRFERENLLLEYAEVGETPFSNIFYEESELRRALERIHQMVIILNNHIGDAVLTIIIAVLFARYFRLNSAFNKKLAVITAQPDLFRSLEFDYPELTITDDVHFAPQSQPDDIYVINTNKKFRDYRSLGFQNDYLPLTSGLFRDADDWPEQTFPFGQNRKKRYYSYPARIVRNLELMLGQKIFSDIGKIKELFRILPTYDADRDFLRHSFHLNSSKRLVVISPGAFSMGKEYLPTRWLELMNIVHSRHLEIQFLFLNDPNPAKSALYAAGIDDIKKGGPDVIRASISFKFMNSLMHMASVVVTPDAGIGHYASMCGTPTVMFSLSNAAFWTGPNTHIVMHPYAAMMYRLGAIGDRGVAHDRLSFYYGKGESRRGASDIPPERIAAKLDHILMRRYAKT